MQSEIDSVCLRTVNPKSDLGHLNSNFKMYPSSFQIQILFANVSYESDVVFILNLYFESSFCEQGQDFYIVLT